MLLMRLWALYWAEKLLKVSDLSSRFIFLKEKMTFWVFLWVNWYCQMWYCIPIKWDRLTHFFFLNKGFCLCSCHSNIKPTWARAGWLVSSWILGISPSGEVLKLTGHLHSNLKSRICLAVEFQPSNSVSMLKQKMNWDEIWGKTRILWSFTSSALLQCTLTIVRLGMISLFVLFISWLVVVDRWRCGAIGLLGPQSSWSPPPPLPFILSCELHEVGLLSRQRALFKSCSVGPQAFHRFNLATHRNCCT